MERLNLNEVQKVAFCIFSCWAKICWATTTVYDVTCGYLYYGSHTFAHFLLTFLMSFLHFFLFWLWCFIVLFCLELNLTGMLEKAYGNLFTMDNIRKLNWHRSLQNLTIGFARSQHYARPIFPVIYITSCSFCSKTKQCITNNLWGLVLIINQEHQTWD